jgi:hypothetical protein
MQLYPDVLPILEKLAGRYRLAVVSNIDDDLLGATRLCREFDVVCTAERISGNNSKYRSIRLAVPPTTPKCSNASSRESSPISR